MERKDLHFTGGADIRATLPDKDAEALQAKVARLPPIKSANSILATEYEPVRFLVPGILPDTGIVCLAASKAAGKTWALLQMGTAVAVGGIAFSRLRCEGARVLFLELELSERRLRERFGKMLISDLPGFDVATAWRTGSEGIADIETAIKARGYGLVIIDVLARLWPRGADMNDYGSVYSILGPLRDMANRLGVCIVLATHTRKAEAEDAIDQVMGSVGIVGTADVVLALRRARGSEDAILRADGNDIESREYVLRFGSEPMGFVITDADPGESKLSPERRAVLEALRSMEEAKAVELAPIVAKDPDTVSKALRALASAGLAEVVRFGVYRAGRSGRTGRSSELPNVGKVTTPTTSTTPTATSRAESPPQDCLAKPSATLPVPARTADATPIVVQCLDCQYYGVSCVWDCHVDPCPQREEGYKYKRGAQTSPEVKFEVLGAEPEGGNDELDIF